MHGFLLLNSGAYGYLHHDVPLVRFGWKGLSEPIQRHGQAVNYIVSDLVGKPGGAVPGEFEITHCYQSLHVCVMRRPGDCRPPRPGERVDSL
jgi:hypothetical protein